MLSFFFLLWGSVSFVLYQIGLVIYRLYFHPLARFPGPKIAAATFWWECYADMFIGEGGQYMNQVEEMHNKYGPVVRVTPDEIHIRDSEWAPVLYAGPGHTRDKDPSLAHAAGTADGTFGTVSHEIHRRRRTPISSYFSKSSIYKYLYPKIWQKTMHMCDVLEKHYKAGTIVSGRATFLGWANDSLRTCSFGDSLNLLDDPEHAMRFDQVFKAFAVLYPVTKQFSSLIPLILDSPLGIRHLWKPLDTILTVHDDMVDMAKAHREEYMAQKASEKDVAAEEHATSTRQNTLYHALAASSMPEEEKLPKRMAHDGFEVLLAGSDTTARSMGVAAYHIIANPHINERLHEELKTVMPNPDSEVDLPTLETLPFLNSIVKETLRIGKVTDHRLSLVAPDEPIKYGDWVMPAGTRVSMTPTRNSYDPEFFPEPMNFAPERWLQDEETVARMNRVFMPFAHGRRGCLGMHFAQAEIRTALATIFRRFQFELHDTIRARDIDHTWAHISGEPSKKGKGLHFKVVKVY